MNLDDFKFIELDRLFAIIGIIISLVLIIYIVKLGKTTIYLPPGILSLISCLIWLRIRKCSNLSLTLNIEKKSPKILFLLFSCYFALLALSIFVFYFRSNLYERPLLYFILISLMCCVVVLEILYKNEDNYNALILTQIVIIGLNIIWTEQLTFVSVVGIDPAWHMMFTNNILNSGHILTGFTYSNLPLFHIEVAIASILTNLNYKLGAMFSISFVQILSITVFMFLIGKKIFNKKLGLLAGLLVCTANVVIQFGWWGIPNSIAAVYIPMIVYLLLKSENISKFLFLVLFLMFALILTHPVTSMWMLLLLLLGLLISNIAPMFSLNDIKDNKISFGIFLFFFVLMFSWWIYASKLFNQLFDIISWGFNVDYFHRGVLITSYWTSTPFIEQLYNNAGLFIYSAVSLVGFLFIISKKKFNAILISFYALLTLAIGFFSLISGKEVLNVRWWYFAEILLSPLVATALIVIYNYINTKKKKEVFLALSIGLLSFLMITSNMANTDNHIFSPNLGVDYGFTESEMNAANFFSHNTNNLSSDFDYAVNPSSSIFINYYNYNRTKIHSIDDNLYNASFNRAGSVIIIRDHIVKNPFRLKAGIYRLNYDLYGTLSDSYFNKIYDSKSVTAYI